MGGERDVSEERNKAGEIPRFLSMSTSSMIKLEPTVKDNPSLNHFLKKNLKKRLQNVLKNRLKWHPVERIPPPRPNRPL